MKLKHHEIEIPQAEGADPFANCKLNRKQYANVLTEIITSFADGFVFAINNPWGEGKTTFVKMWQQDLKNKDFKTLYFNAWENDFEQDVLVALISELGEIKNKPVEAYKKVLNKAVTLSTKVVPAIAKHLAKRAIGDEAAEAIIEAVAEYGTEELKDQIDLYTSRKKSIQDFKDNLAEFICQVDPEKPLVFIIDELDRCRPSYSVEVLEQIKHLFSVPGIVFVLSLDKIQLGHAICGVYGSNNINSEEYLRRFIDLEYSIPKPSLKDFTDYLFDYYAFHEFYNDQRIGNSNFRNEITNFKLVYLALFSGLKSSLRIHEKIFARLRVIIKSYHEDQYSFPEILILLLFLKTFQKHLYQDILSKVFTAQELLEKFDQIFKHNIDDEELNAITFAVARFVYSYCNYREPSSAKSMITFESETNSEVVNLSFKLNQDRFNSIFLSLNRDYNIDTISLDWLITRVELTENLKNN
ncbi:KAP family P-loop NTPase fold protein [Robertkochia flava]|uniref:KAP family P-loop NTPase fold protein n=1 Tax=Robertkochia flava TaxID=3447986 RepID=UPI001CC96C3B|nr:P-loop NTPase fold protein [Robertkochia marina]